MTNIVVSKTPGNPQLAFDALPENIVKVGSDYYTPYRAGWNAAHYSIGLARATAPEGPYTDLGTILARIATGWEAGSDQEVDSPFLVEDSGTFYLFYSVNGPDNGAGGISYATASAVTGPYTRLGSAVLSPATAGAWDSRLVRGAALVQLPDTTWAMYYTGELSSATYNTTDRVGLANAPDITGPWTRDAGNPIVLPGSSGAWDDAIVRDPHVWIEDDGSYWMLFSGAAGGGGATPGGGFPWGVGIAVAAAPEGPWTKNAHNPFLPPGGSTAWDGGGPFRGGVWKESGAYTLMYAAFNLAATNARGGTATLEFVPESGAVGWDVYAAADPNGALLATLEHATERQMRVELNGTGQGRFTINRHAAEATASVLAKGNIVKVRIPEISDDYIASFILETGDFDVLSGGEEGGEMLSFGGRGGLAYIDRAIMWDEAFTTGLDISDTWTEIWEGSFTWRPVGTAFLAATPGYVYAIGQFDRRIHKIDQTTHKVVASSPVLWSGSTKLAGGLSADPADANVMWAIETPWAGGYAGNTKIRKIDISGSIGSWNVSATHDLGSAVKLTAIKADSSVLWCSRYDGTATIQKRSKTTGSLTTAYTITYGGVTQTKAVGISVNGSNLAYWFSGTKRALIAASSAPATITDKISTQAISAFGGDWSTESAQDYFYMDSYTAGRVWKYQITAATPHDPVNGIWRLDEATPGAILWRLMQEWQAVGRPQQPLPDATYVFTSTDDSDGDTWATHAGTLEFDARIGDGGLETVLRLIPYGLTVQMAHDLELGGYNSFGSDKSGGSFGSGVVRFEAGVNIVDELTRRLDERQADSHLLVGGDGGAYVTATEDDLGYVREGFLSTDLQDQTAMAGTGAAELGRQREIADSVAFAVLFGDDEGTGRYMPGPAGSSGHFWVGDTVRLHTGSDNADFDEEDLRVYAITLTEQANGEWKPTVELTSPFLLEPTAGQNGSASGSSSGTSIGGSGTSGSGGTTSSSITVTDGADISIPGVTTIQAEGAYSTTPGTAIIPIPDTTPPLLEELLTDETDTTLVPHPDGGGGVAWGVDATGGAGTGTPGWFNVKDPAYGAVGDGSTDDTAAINLAIAALVAAGRGVLFFPAGTYKTTGALTALSVPCLVLGDGSTSYDNASPISEVTCTSQTAVLFTVSTKACRFEKLAMVNTYGGTPSAGAAVLVDSAYLEQRVDFEGCFFQGFYDNVDVKVGGQWTMHGCMSIAPVRYGIRIRNTVNADAGDWSISDCNFSAQSYNSTAAIEIESAGGGKIVNTKINMALDSKRFGTGINLAFTTGSSSTILLVSNCSIENVSGDAIKVATSGTGTFSFVAIENVQVGLYSNNSGYAVNINAGTGGGGAGGIKGVIVSGLVARTDGTPRNAISLVNVDTVRIGHVVIVGFSAVFATSGATNVVDDTGSIAASVAITGTPSTGDVPTATGGATATWQAAPGGGVTGFAAPAFVLGTVAAAGVATTAPRSDGTIAAFDATTPGAIGAAATGSVAKAARRDHVHATGAGTPTTSAIGDAAATGSGPAAAMTDHVHGREALSTATPLVESGAGAVGTAAKSSREDHVHPAGSGTVTEAQIYGVGGHWEVLMDPATSSPPVPLTTPDGTDWVYGWLSDGG